MKDLELKWFPWNGSKKWILKDISEILKLWTKEGDYIEPFVGSGSISYLAKKLFPEVKQIIADANPWLVSAFQCQLNNCNVSEKFENIEYWRNLKDSDFENLTVEQRANRFAICLLTAWGNRWKSKKDGSMGSENPVNKKFINQEYLKNKLLDFFNKKWLNENDQIYCCDWKDLVTKAKSKDIVYIDPPYPESLGYGNQWWSFSDQLDVIDWISDAIKKNINVVVSNMSTVERLYRRIGMKTKIVSGPRSSKTRKSREEVIAYYINKGI